MCLPDADARATLPAGREARAPTIAEGRGPGQARAEARVDSYNVYMDEAPAGGVDGDENWEVEFRVVPNSADDGDPENNAVLAGLDLIDLINLRDALQQEIDNFALTALETQVGLDEADEETMP